MSTKPLDPRIADRLRSQARGSGSPSAKAAIEAWVSRAEAGMEGVGSPSDLADLVRALARLMYSRSLYGFMDTMSGSDINVRLQHADVTAGLSIETDLVEVYALDEAGKAAVVSARTEGARTTLGALERAFSDVFK